MSNKRLLIVALILGALTVFYWTFPEPAAKPDKNAVNEAPLAKGSASRSMASLPASRKIAANPESALKFDDFQKNSSARWQIDRNNDFDAPRSLSAGRWSLPSKDPAEMSAAFIRDYSLGMFAVPPEQLNYHRAVTTDRTKVIFQQYIDGTRVYGASLGLVYENGDLVRVQNDLTPANVERVESQFTANQAAEKLQDVRSILLPPNSIVVKGDGLDPEKVYFYTTGKLVTAFRMYVDAPAENGSRRLEILLDADRKHVITAHDAQIE